MLTLLEKTIENPLNIGFLKFSKFHELLSGYSDIWLGSYTDISNWLTDTLLVHNESLHEENRSQAMNYDPKGFHKKIKGLHFS